MDSPIVQISEGKIKGTVKTDVEGKNYYAFLSIPYAKPPLGTLRFKAPEPSEPWEGIRDASKQGPSSVQSYLGAEVIGSEDCLGLHVFTKNLPNEEEKLKPVMVWIHGGGFVLGTNDTKSYGPDLLITEDIVLVSIQYRVGLLGFLSLQDTSLNVPGNAGLKDQVQALKWVQNNIKHFNGEPDNVTIFGESAGGTSVEYLVLSPSAKNLFHKAIMQSGSALCPWAQGQFDPSDFAKYVGHPNLEESEILKLLTDMPAEELHKAQTKYQQLTFAAAFGLIAPVIEKPNPTAFITEHPMDLIQSGRYNTVPVITGYCDNEGLIVRIIDALQSKTSTEDSLINYYLPFDTNFKDAEQVASLTKRLKEFYHKEEYKSNVDLLPTDGLFVIPTLISAINQAKNSNNPVYLYRFTVSGGLNYVKKLAKITAPGACHGDDLGYLWKSEMTSPEAAEAPDKLAIHRFVKMWTNFARDGIPIPKGSDLNVAWKPIQGDDINFLDIGEELVPGVNPESDRLNFWKEIFQMNPVTAKFL